MIENNGKELGKIETKEEKHKNSFSNLFSKIASLLRNTKKVNILLVIVIIILVSTIGIGFKSNLFTESKTTKIGFEDIGELATESCTTTEINVVDKSRKLYGVNIPFTQTKYIYSYDVNVKAGIDFSQVKWKRVNDNAICVTLPEIRVLGKGIIKDSFKVYHEKESIFTNVTLEENNKAQSKLEDTALKDAIDNGLYDRAKESAEKQLESFFKANEDYKDCNVYFE